MGKMYDSTRNIYANTASYISINDKHTEWFGCRSGVRQGDCLSSGVRQGDCLSPTIFFSLFIDDLVSEINSLQLGIDLKSTKPSLLLYADEFCFKANNEADFQAMLDTLHNWCVLIGTA